MSNELRITAGIQATKPSANLTYYSRPTSFTASMSGTKGPSPGTVLATTAGINVDLSKLTTPGMCRIINKDPTNYVEVGPFDGTLNRFLPFMELLPGEFYVFRLSRFLGTEMGTGTGTGPSGNATQLHVKAHTATCEVVVEAFDA